MSKIDEAKVLMEKGWKAREDLDFDNAEDLLNSALDLFKREQDWYNVTECLNHLAYSYKLRAVHHLQKAVSLAEESLKISTGEKTKKLGVLRARFSTLQTRGDYERALPLIDEYISLQTKETDKADALSHKALCLLRTGKINEALTAINPAEEVLEKEIGVSEDIAVFIWYTHALMTKAIILFNMNKLTEAKMLAEKAYNISVSKNLKTRKSQAEELLKLFN